MKRRLLVGVLVVLAALLALNTVVLNQQTKDAEATVEGSRILSLPGGEVQVTVEGPTAASTGQAKAPVVLIHCYLCSLRWWDELAPRLARDRRVIRVDLLGHGGSEKPSSGYGIGDQAQLVAGALNELDVQGAVVVGQSMGAAVAVGVAEQSSQLVDRVVDMSLAADNDASELPFLARLGYVPLLGQAMYRLTPDAAIRAGFDEAFAPGFDISDGFEDMIVEDFRAMTYTSYKESHDALESYRDEQPLDSRMRAAAVPLMVILGADDQVVDPEEAAEGLRDVPGVRITTLKGVGHTPQIEAPRETAALIEEFARDAGDEVVAAPSRRAAAKKRGSEGGKRKDDSKRKQKSKRRSGN